MFVYVYMLMGFELVELFMKLWVLVKN